MAGNEDTKPVEDLPVKNGWIESLKSIVFALLLAFTLRAFVIEAFKIPSGSMIPTLAIGDQIFVNKFIYGLRIPGTSTRLFELEDPARGEVIVFICPDKPEHDYIKRVVAIGGDYVEVKRGKLYLNDKLVAEELEGPLSYRDVNDLSLPNPRWSTVHALAYQQTLGEHEYTILHDATTVDYHDFPRRRVPEGHVFVMGDNRDHSRDSRLFRGHFVPNNSILGRSLFVWWSWGEDGLNWDRLFTWID